MALIDTIVFGTIDLLVPLDLGHLGTSTAVIAAALTSGALLGAVVGPAGGRLVDRIGAGPVGLATAIIIAAFPIILAFGLSRGGLLGSLVVGGPVFAVAASAMYPLASAGADRAQIPHVTVTGILGASWAVGFAAAPVAASVIASATSQAVAFSVSAALTLPLLWVIARDGRGATAS
jgi:MFS family permease